MKNNKYKAYKCFSVPQKEFLINKGLEYISIALDPKTKNTFWLFLKSDKLDCALTEWQNNNPRKRS